MQNNTENEQSDANALDEEMLTDPIIIDDPYGQLLGEIDEWKDRAARRQAELENYRKRVAREKSEAMRFANERLLSEMLTIVDNFDFGLQAAQAASPTDKNNDKSDDKNDSKNIILQGMEMIAKQIEQFLENHGVRQIESIGKQFDPHNHEAVSYEISDDVPENHVIAAVRKGYKIQDKLLRPANVIVSSGKKSTDKPEEKTEDKAAEKADENNENKKSEK